MEQQEIFLFPKMIDNKILLFISLVCFCFCFCFCSCCSFFCSCSRSSCSCSCSHSPIPSPLPFPLLSPPPLPYQEEKITKNMSTKASTPLLLVLKKTVFLYGEASILLLLLPLLLSSLFPLGGCGWEWWWGGWWGGWWRGEGGRVISCK